MDQGHTGSVCGFFRSLAGGKQQATRLAAGRSEDRIELRTCQRRQSQLNLSRSDCSIRRRCNFRRRLLFAARRRTGRLEAVGENYKRAGPTECKQPGRSYQYGQKRGWRRGRVKGEERCKK